mmetsp:Transcript_8208/g.11848  ORF Transcript_8208/g.11848 Transcript_8208/m.11848 type:complete len:258 (+) Transcript_8208:99-872(+)
MYLIANVWSNRADICHDLFSVLGNLVVVPSGDGFWVKEWGNKSNRSGTHFEVVTSIIKVNTGSGIDGKERQCRTDSLDPHGTTGDAREKFLERCTSTVSIHHLGGSLTSWNTDNVPFSTPLDNIREHHWCDDEFSTSIDGIGSILGGEDSTTSNHNIALVFLTEVSKMVKAIRGSKCEFSNLETTINSSLHGLGACLRSGRTKHGASTNFSKLVQDSVEVLSCVHAIKGISSGSAHSPGSGGGPHGGTRSSDTKSHL